MEGKNKVVLYWVVGVLVLAGALWMFAKPTIAPEVLVSASPTVKATPKPVVRVSSQPTTAAPKTYSDALARYGSSRIQFDMYCQAIPSSSTFKQGATIMLDNRSGDARTVAVGGMSYNLAGYGWRIITLSAKILPATLSLDCGSGRNVGTIILQQ